MFPFLFIASHKIFFLHSVWGKRKSLERGVETFPLKVFPSSSTSCSRHSRRAPLKGCVLWKKQSCRRNQQGTSPSRRVLSIEIQYFLVWVCVVLMTHRGQGLVLVTIECSVDPKPTLRPISLQLDFLFVILCKFHSN